MSQHGKMIRRVKPGDRLTTNLSLSGTTIIMAYIQIKIINTTVHFTILHWSVSDVALRGLSILLAIEHVL